MTPPRAKQAHASQATAREHQRGAGAALDARGLAAFGLPRHGPVDVDLPIPPRALAIGAHADDVELGCGATLAKWASEGCDVRIAVLTDGARGTWDPNADHVRLARQRKQEARRAARQLGAGDLVFFDAPDGQLEQNRALERWLVALVRTARPTVVVTHDPWRRYRLHPDHRVAGFAVLDALVAAREPAAHRDLGLAAHRPEAVLLFEPDEPNHVEHAGPWLEAKLAALLEHRSQYSTALGLSSATRRDARARLRTVIEAQLAEHGAIAGLEAGEAFRLILDT
jgi:LmbE family N-acetylglucosaminyl deacetylase